MTREPIILQWQLFDNSMKNQTLKSSQGISQKTKQISGPDLGPVPQPKPYSISNALHPGVMNKGQSAPTKPS